MSKKATTEETLFQKERRLKNRKQTFKMSYKKGVFYSSWAHDKLMEYLKQPEVLVRVHATGEMDDGTSFISITIEGFTPPEDGI